MNRLNRRHAEAVLVNHGWLSGQTEPFRAELFRWSVVQSMAMGTIVYHPHDPPGGIYGLVSGALAISAETEGASPIVLRHGAPGVWLGASPFLTGGPRLVELRAASDCVVMHLPLAAMEVMAAQDPGAVRAFAQIVVANYVSLMELLQILLLPGSERRIAATLLRAARAGADPVPMTQAELAQSTNTSLRQVSATLRGFAEQGLVEPGYRAIRVLDLARLGRCAAGERALPPGVGSAGLSS